MKKNYRKNHGQVVITVVVLFTIISLTVVFGAIAPMLRQNQITRDLQASKKSYYTAEAGSEDIYFRIKNNIPYPLNSSMSIDGGSAQISVKSIGSNEQRIESIGNYNNHIRAVFKDISVTNGFSFNFGIQTGIGGLFLSNNARVNGNVYSGGIIQSTNTSPNAYNYINGSVVSAGPGGSVRYINASSSVYSRLIQDTIVGRDAYYQTFGGATSSVIVGGVSHPNSPDQPLIEFPISDELITEWKNTAEAGGSVTCTNGVYTINTSLTIGPKKIPCNLVLSGNNITVTLGGAVWVSGDITISGSGGTGVQMKVADSLGNRSVPVIADDQMNRSTRGVITINGNSNFYGSTGNADSYVMLLSQNNSAEIGGNNLAINIINGAAGNLLVYASHGEIKLQNNVSLREVTAYKLTLINNTVVNYAIGLAQTLFTSGPGGAWKVRRWREG